MFWSQPAGALGRVVGRSRLPSASPAPFLWERLCRECLLFQLGGFTGTIGPLMLLRLELGEERQAAHRANSYRLEN